MDLAFHLEQFLNALHMERDSYKPVSITVALSYEDLKNLSNSYFGRTTKASENLLSQLSFTNGSIHFVVKS